MPRKLKPHAMFYITDEEEKILAIGIARTEAEFEQRALEQIEDILEEDNYFINEIDEVWRYNHIAQREGVVEITPPDELEEMYE